MMTQNKFMELINKDNRLMILFGSMLVDIILLIVLVIYVGVQLAFR